MTTLTDRLKSMIRASGPISIATYMDLCLHDRRHGYYATRPGLGEDFVTAPEISQVFGELIGLWAANEWREMGCPKHVTLIEIGPGRGTLMADALRATQRVDGFHTALRLRFIEASPVLRDQLSHRFDALAPEYVDQIKSIDPDIPFILIANEWLDCLPVQQFVKVGNAWHERVVGLDPSGQLSFGLTADALPPELHEAADQEAIEIQPGLKMLTDTISGLMASTGGRALLIDYGSADRTPEDTLRSYQGGAQIHPLSAPGESDLTCDVDFARLQRLFEAGETSLEGPISQSQFLLSLGAETRLNQLVRENPEGAQEIYDSVRKLVDPAEMGSRFQVIIARSDA